MAKRNYSSWADLGELFEAADRLRDQAARRMREEAACAVWTPAADIYETSAGYVIEVDLPGIEQADVVLEVTASALVVSGQRPGPCEAGGFHVVERDCGPFARSFGLPRDADSEAVSASMKNGVLTISIPRRGEKPRRSILVG